jgi:DNA repair protein RadC
VTRQIVQAGKLVDIDVLDHLVVGCQRWVSVTERGLGFWRVVAGAGLSLIRPT